MNLTFIVIAIGAVGFYLYWNGKQVMDFLKKIEEEEEEEREREREKDRRL